MIGRILRWGLGAAGLASMAFGAVTLLTDRRIGDWAGVLEWLAFVVVLHDGLLAPSVLLLGAALGTRWRRQLRRPFVVAGALTAVALPVLLRPGPVANPSVLPLNYPRGWVVSVGAVGALTLIGAAGRWISRRVGAGRRRVR